MLPRFEEPMIKVIRLDILDVITSGELTGSDSIELPDVGME